MRSSLAGVSARLRLARDLEAGTAVESGPAEAAFRRMSAVSLAAPEGDPLDVLMTTVSPVILYAGHLTFFPSFP